MTLLVAREKSGKSTLAAAAGAAVSNGDRFLEEATLAGPALYVAAEGHLDDLARNLSSFGADGNQLFVLRPWSKGRLLELESAIQRVRPLLVVIDTLASFVEPLELDPFRSSDWTKPMLSLSQLAQELSCAILVLHHGRKSDGEPRDSTAIMAGVDVILTVADVKNSDTERRIRAQGRWHIEDCVVQLEKGETWAYSLVRPDRPLVERVLDFVRQHPGCSKRELRKGLTGRAQSIDEAAQELLDSVVENRGTDSAWSLYATPDGGEQA